jgi:hypothetical protein
MKYLFTARYIFWALLLLITNSAHADVIFTNIGSSFTFKAADTLGTLAGNTSEAAVAFTPTNDFVFSSASFMLGLASGQNMLDVTLATDFIPAGLNTYKIGTVLENIQTDGAMITESGSVLGGLATVTSTLNPTLFAGTEYWLILSLPDPQAFGRWYVNETLNGNPFAIGSTPLAPFFAVFPPGSEVTPAFSVSGTVVPEPSLRIVTIFVLVFLLALSRRRRLAFLRPE